MTPPAPAIAERAPPVAWIFWGLGAIFFCYAFFQRVAPSVMVDALMRDFAVGGAVLGNLSAIYFYAYAGLQLPVGLCIDRWGPRRVMSTALLVATLGGLLFALTETLGLAYLGRLLIGGGCAFGFVGALTLATAWFPLRRFALITGLTMLAGMAGAVLGQAPLAALVEVAGWRGSLVGAAAFGLALAVAIALVVRDRPPERGHAGAQAAGVGRPMLASLGQVAARRQTWILSLYGAAQAASLLGFASLWGVPYLMQAHALSRPVAALSTSLVSIGWALGAPFSGWVSDHVGRRKPPLVIAAAVALASMLAVLYLPDLPLSAVQALLFLNGFAGGHMIICYGAAREHNPGEAVATTYGFVNMCSVGSGALLQPLIGFLLDLNWDGRLEAGARVYSAAAYEVGLSVIPISFAVALLAAFLVRETWCRPVSLPEIAAA